MFSSRWNAKLRSADFMGNMIETLSVLNENMVWYQESGKYQESQEALTDWHLTDLCTQLQIEERCMIERQNMKEKTPG